MDSSFLMALMAVLGGTARYVLGERDMTVPVWRAVVALFVIALPVGIFAGTYTETLVNSDELNFIKYIVSYIAASKSKDIILYVWSMDLQKFKELITRKLG
jgi:hypothetical protein